MPSDRKQINVRVDDEAAELMSRLIPVMSEAIGLPISQSDLFRLGLVELKKKYLEGKPALTQLEEQPAAKTPGKPKGKK